MPALSLCERQPRRRDKHRLFYAGDFQHRYQEPSSDESFRPQGPELGSTRRGCSFGDVLIFLGRFMYQNIDPIQAAQSPCSSMLSLKRIRVRRWPCPLWPQDRTAAQSTLLVRRGTRSAHSKFPSRAESFDSWSSLLSFLLCAGESMHRRPLLRLWRSP